MSTSPLLTPLTFLRADTSEMCSETRVRGSIPGVVSLMCGCNALNLLLRSSPRITVRGHLVQGANSVAAKSSASIKGDACGAPNTSVGLAFRRATEGRRVLRRVWGVKRGQREPYGALAPFVPPPDGGISPPVNTGTPSAVGYGLCRLQRRTAVSAEGLPSADGKIFLLTFFLKERKPASSRRPRKPS